MPNAPKTPTRTIRVSSDLWAAVKDKAAIEGRTVTDVIVEALKRYISPSQRTPGYPDQELWDSQK
jgi:predicted DNA binding CopG/RHH family protein